MKFVHLPAKTQLFSLPPHYKPICSKGEQDNQFWKELAIIFVEWKHNTETSQNGFPISIYQGGLSHEPYFIAIDIKRWAIINPNKKIVATYIIGELTLLDWFMGIWKLKKGYCYDQYLMYLVWTRVEGNDKWSAALKLSQSAPYVEGVISLLFLHVTMTH